MSENKFFATLKKKLERAPSQTGDQKFWRKFDEEFGNRANENRRSFAEIFSQYWTGLSLAGAMAGLAIFFLMQKQPPAVTQIVIPDIVASLDSWAPDSDALLVTPNAQFMSEIPEYDIRLPDLGNINKFKKGG